MEPLIPADGPGKGAAGAPFKQGGDRPAAGAQQGPHDELDRDEPPPPDGEETDSILSDDCLNVGDEQHGGQVRQCPRHPPA